ncbi:hypothetical protein ZIOFF_014216 [Zingiber officinale]|uniref:Uncharacterized protein n=1 Tax=Zingiber officinale TaxID=94328 RepID=A0A8J5LPB4_ZINOF|nr:hypothetical protein ZIOFF_014216 [Zingiber officinale]
MPRCKPSPIYLLLPLSSLSPSYPYCRGCREKEHRQRVLANFFPLLVESGREADLASEGSMISSSSLIWIGNVRRLICCGYVSSAEEGKKEIIKECAILWWDN